MRFVFYVWLTAILALLAVAAVHVLSAGVAARSLFFVGAAVVTAAVLVWLARRARDWCWAVMISGTALYVAAYAAQIYILEFRQELYSVTRSDTDWDNRTRDEVIADLADQGIVARPEIIFTQYRGKAGLLLDGQRVLHLGTFPDTTIVQCNETGQWSIFKSDRYGFRNPPAVWNSRADALLAGDSYISGACVSDQNTLRDLLVPNVGEVVSVGAAGYGPLAVLATIREFAARLEPRAVIWFFNAENDVRDLDRELRNSILVRYLKQANFRQPVLGATEKINTVLVSDYENWLAERQRANNRNTLFALYHHFVSCKRRDAPRDCATYRLRVEFLIWKLKLAVLRDFIDWHWVSLRVTIPEKESFSIHPEKLAVLEEIFVEVATMASRMNTRLLFVYHPPRLSTLFRVPDNIAQPVLDAARRQGFNVLDLGDALNEHSDPKILYAGHFNSTGYRFAAAKIGQALTPLMKSERQIPANAD